MLLRAQDGRCALCREPLGANPYIDHDHVIADALGVVDERSVRGLLHPWCNTRLGMWHDDAAMLRRAADYVERRRD